jgi:hypothetical protein
MSSRLALSEISHAFSLPGLEGILSATNSHITGFVAALTFASKGFILPHSQEFLQIVAPSKDQCLIVIGYLMANGYEMNTMPLSAEVGVPWPSTAPIAYRVSQKATYVVIKTYAQVEASVVAAENFCLPSYTDEPLLTRRMTWLTKPESALTEDDHYLIDKYNDAGFVIFTQEPKQLTIASRQAPLALSTVLPAEHPLRVRRHLNSLSPYQEQGITGDHESAFSTMLAAGAAGIPLPVPTTSIRRQKAAPSTSDDSTPSSHVVGASAHRGRTRTDSELSDYHDCTPPDSIPRIFFPRDSRFSTSDTE